jgi:hypothetical protein
VWNIYFQGVRAKSPIHTGVALLPLMLLTIPSTIITGRFIARSGKFVHFVWIGWSLVSIGNGLIIIWFVDTPTVAWAIIEMVCGVGQVSHHVLSLNESAQRDCFDTNGRLSTVSS